MSRWWRDVVLVNDQDTAELLAALEAQGYVILLLDGSAARGKDSLLDAFDRDVPVPGLKSAGSWDAFADCVWQRVMEGEAGEAAALVWTHADRMLDHGLEDLLAAVTTLTRVSKQVESAAEREPESGAPAAFRTFLVGAGPNFPPLAETATPS